MEKREVSRDELGICKGSLEAIVKESDDGEDLVAQSEELLNTIEEKEGLVTENELLENIANVEELAMNDNLMNDIRVNNEVPEHKKTENNEDEICDNQDESTDKEKIDLEQVSERKKFSFGRLFRHIFIKKRKESIINVWLSLINSSQINVYV